MSLPHTGPETLISKAHTIIIDCNYSNSKVIPLYLNSQFPLQGNHEIMK